MSEYVNIFICTENDEFIKIYHFSRNSNIGNYLFYLSPYGKVMKLTKPYIQSVYDDVETDINHYEEMISNYTDCMSNVERFNNSVQDKYAKICEISAEIKEYRHNIKEMKSGLKYLDFLFSLLYFSECELYFGTEISVVNPEKDILVDEMEITDGV